MRRASASSGFRAANRAFFTLVAGFAALAIVVRADPDRAADWLAGVPIVGAAIGPQTTLGAEITLDNVQGGYERLRNDRTVFVIRGEAVNNSRGPVERIQVEGTLYSAAGEVDRKVISTGNETTLRLSELSESEIVLLQRFAPRTPLAPGERVPFSIVFLEPPRDLREFSSRVLSARPASSRAAGRPTDRGGAPAPVG